jgi:hypothetical protein
MLNSVDRLAFYFTFFFAPQPNLAVSQPELPLARDLLKDYSKQELKFANMFHGVAPVAVLAGSMLSALAAPTSTDSSDPFAIIDPQNWVNPDNMTWADFVNPPGTNWSDPSKKGYSRNFNIAMITVDYPDHDFVMTRDPESDIYGNPQPLTSKVARKVRFFRLVGVSYQPTNGIDKSRIKPAEPTLRPHKTDGDMIDG